MSLAEEIERKPGKLSWLLGTLRTILLGTLLGMSAGTSIVSLGWLTRQMRTKSLRVAELPTNTPGWVLGDPQGGPLGRFIGGLAANIRSGLMTTISLGLAAFPFAVVWFLSWWAGWENSFSKGYEQAFIGPATGLFGAALFCLIMVWHPMALAHQAVEDRALSLFEWRRVRSAVRHAGIGYFLLAITTVVFALPLFAGRGLIVFASNIVPGFDTMSAEAAAELADGIALAKALYAFTALLILRNWAAGIYARAVARALDGPENALWEDSPLASGKRGGSRPWKLTHWIRTVILVIVWFGLAAQVYVGQFLNHDWHMWLTHPMWLLPWPG